MNGFFLAFAYLRHHVGRSIVLVLVTALILFVPFATQIMLSASEERLTARAETTPLLLGRRGSALDLTMAALYFSDDRPTPVTMSEVETIWDSGLGIPIPLHFAFESGSFRIVGTSLDYFDFRELEIAEGRNLAVLGDATIGADVAAALGQGVGDTLVSSPENLFDLDGVYPLEMPIVGVLARTGTPDDSAIFVDVKTAWVIAGIGHGHADVIPEGSSGDVVAAAGIAQYQRITPDNIDTFHFHGDPADYPLSAVIVSPNDTRSATILLGRYLDPDGTVQMIEPAAVVQRLVDRIFRIKSVLDAVTFVIGIAALAAVGLAVFLSYLLRADEMATAVKLGARRGMVLRLLLSETLILLLLAGTIASAGVLAVSHQADVWVGWLAGFGV